MTEEMNQEMETTESELSGKVEEVADPQTETGEQQEERPQQDKETNAQYADMRRKQELEQERQRARQLEEQNAYLERLAKMSGYSNTDEFIKAVEEAEKQEQVKKQAQQMGIDESTYQEYFQPVNQQLESTKQETQQLRNELFQLQVEREINTLKQKYPDFDNVRDQVFQMAHELGLPPNKLDYAYRLATYDNVGKQKEQEVLARVTGRDEKQILPSQDKPNNNQFSPSNMSLDEIQKISERVRRGERITF